MKLSKELTTVTPLSKAIALTLFIVLPIITFSFGMNYQSALDFMKNDKQAVLPSPEAVACTMDAKLCPDGSSVGRTPPSCEFEKCPGENEPGKTFTGEITNINYGCHVDEDCVIGVGKGSVIVEKGMIDKRLEQQGTYPKELLDENKLGENLHRMVEVFAASNGGRTDQFTLYGNSSYYLKFIDDAAPQSFCGGIAGKTCPAGFYCKYEGSYPDAGGTCMRDAAKRGLGL